MLLWPTVHIIVLVISIESSLQNLHPDLPVTCGSPLAGPWFLYASASPAIKLLCSLRFMVETHGTELYINSIYKEFSSVLQPLWMTESMQRLIISARPTNEISVKGPAGQSLSTNDLTYFLLLLPTCSIIPWWRIIHMRYPCISTWNKSPSFSSLPW